MSWVNAFSLGPCAIQVTINGFAMKPSDMIEAGLAVIEENGVVTLTWNGTGSQPQTVIVSAVPNYALTVNQIANTPAQLINAIYNPVIYNQPAWIVTDGVRLSNQAIAPLPNPWIVDITQLPDISLGMQATAQHGT
jgi:hypothetical protein